MKADNIEELFEWKRPLRDLKNFLEQRTSSDPKVAMNSIMFEAENKVFHVFLGQIVPRGDDALTLRFIKFITGAKDIIELHAAQSLELEGIYHETYYLNEVSDNGTRLKYKDDKAEHQVPVQTLFLRLVSVIYQWRSERYSLEKLIPSAKVRGRLKELGLV